jgi:hypothetical protein
MKKTARIILLALVCVLVLSVGSTAFARDIQRIDGTIYSNNSTFTYSAWMVKHNSHSDPAVVNLESVTIPSGQFIICDMQNSAYESCLTSSPYTLYGATRFQDSWSGSHGQPNYSYRAGLCPSSWATVKSSFSPDTY